MDLSHKSVGLSHKSVTDWQMSFTMFWSRIGYVSQRLVRSALGLLRWHGFWATLDVGGIYGKEHEYFYMDAYIGKKKIK